MSAPPGESPMRTVEAVGSSGRHHRSPAAPWTESANQCAGPNESNMQKPTLSDTRVVAPATTE
jgi:hypothetical protein